jgi:large subunit ribosomal protein L25
MRELALNPSPRSVVGKQVKALRRGGITPLVMYGSKVDAVPLQADSKELARVLKQAGGSRLITVNTGSGSQQALARAVQREPISGQILHVDLFAVSMTETINVEVPLVLMGKSPAVDRGEGVLVTGLGSIEIEALPGDLIDNVRVDLGGLNKVGDALHVKDVQVPSTIKILTDPDEMIARVTYLAAEEVPAVELAAEQVEPEVIARGKAEEAEDTEKV